jgi:nucleoid-associated protein YgaU
MTAARRQQQTERRNTDMVDPGGQEAFPAPAIGPGQLLKLPFGGFRYRIERGDTLFQLAEWVYGDGNSWPIIWQSNPGIPNPNQIQAGLWIWVP